jgi:hypothetical protein
MCPHASIAALVVAGPIKAVGVMALVAKNWRTCVVGSAGHAEEVMGSVQRTSFIRRTFVSTLSVQWRNRSRR